MKARMAWVGALLAGSALAASVNSPQAAGVLPPKFTRKPVVEKTAAGAKISFAVDRETDVTVSIESTGPSTGSLDVARDRSGQGEVVRHLAAGMLGVNAPAPFKANSLVQSIEWDGKGDWGKPVTLHPQPFRVRVALGLGVTYDRAVIVDPMIMGDLANMAVAPDGTLYAVIGGPGIASFNSQRLVALNRDGSYQRTLIPPPSSATKEQIEALGGVPVQVGQRVVPICTSVRTRQNTAFWSSDGVAVTPGGQFMVLHCEEFTGPAAPRIGMVDTTGSASPAQFLAASLLPGVPKAGFNANQRSYLAASSDGKYAYVSGLAPKRASSSEKPTQWSAVYRVTLPDRSPAVPFFGDPDKTGNDETHLGSSAHGMASDGKGHLLICDPTNNRVVVVSEADGKFAGSFPFDAPEYVAVDPRNGAVYLFKVGKGAEGVKLSGWKDPKPLAAMRLPAPRNWITWRFAVDTGATPPVIWVGNEVQLLRLEDLGDTFSEAKLIGSADGRDFVSLVVDHYRSDPEIYVRRGANDGWMRYNEKTEKTDKIMPVELPNSSGAGLEVGPDGNLYIQRWPYFLFKCDRDGKPLKWEEPFVYPPGITPYGGKPSGNNAIYNHVCMNYMPHTLGIRQDGHFFFFESPKMERGTKTLVEMLPSGKRVSGNPIIWEATDSVVGPRFDQQGNLYVADVFRPLDQLIPPEFAGVAGPVTLKSQWGVQNPKCEAAMMYGSIMKFSPKGGMIVLNGSKPAPCDGQPRLDASLKTVNGAFCRGGRDWRAMDTVKVTGAEWIHFGVSHVDHLYCNCENIRFDLDPFGRVWYPDLGRYRVGVLDSNGNVITMFGSYGNAESCGPDSPVVGPKTGKVRPRLPTDPKDLKSPFAEPEIAFSWLMGVGATDRYAYMGDTLNRRLLRAKLVYAAEEVCPIEP